MTVIEGPTMAPTRIVREPAGATMIPDRVISPNWPGDWKATTDQPNLRDLRDLRDLRRRLAITKASRISA